MRIGNTALVIGLVGLLVGGAPSRSACAYGGRYRGPVGDVPPDRRTPWDPAPTRMGAPVNPAMCGPPSIGCHRTGSSEDDLPAEPDEPDGPSVPDASDPFDPPPAAPPEPRRPIDAGPTGRTTGHRTGRRAFHRLDRTHLDEWTFWWEYNAGLHEPPGTDASAEGPEGLRAFVDERVVPELRKLLHERDGHFAVQAAAAMALARIGDPTVERALLDIASDRSAVDGGSSTHHRVKREGATLALGLLPALRPATQAALREILEQPSRSRSFAGPFAAVALGLSPTRDGSTGAALIRVAADPDADVQRRVAAVTALGLLRSAEAMPRLIQAVTLAEAKPTENPPTPEPDWPDIVVAEAVRAVGEIGSTVGPVEHADAAAAALLAHLHGRRKPRTSHLVRASIPGALARLAPRLSVARRQEIVERLSWTDHVRSRPVDVSERAQALIALGALGALASQPSAGPELRRSCVTALRHAETGRAPRSVLAPHALFALARVQAAGRTDQPVADDRLRAALTEGSHPIVRAAAARALVLAGTEDASERLAAIVADAEAPPIVHRHALVALHRLAPRPETRAALLRLSRSAAQRDRVHAVAALGRDPDAAAIVRLLEIIEDPDEAHYVTGTAARVLGRARTPVVVRRLLQVAVDRKERFSSTSRAMAVAALGNIGARPDTPDLERLAAGRNHRALTPALQELLSIL